MIRYGKRVSDMQMTLRSERPPGLCGQTIPGAPWTLLIEMTDDVFRLMERGFWACKDMDDPAARIAELLQIEADARKAGQITKDGKFAGIGAKVWHPKHGIICGFVEVDGDSNTVAAFRRGFWDGFGERPEGWNDYPVSDCYSTPEAAEAAREEKA